MLSLIQFRMQWMGLLLWSPSHSLLLCRIQSKRTGTSNVKTAQTFASSTPLPSSSRLRWRQYCFKIFLYTIIWVAQVEVKEPADGQWGQQIENGSWTGVVPILTSYNQPKPDWQLLHVGGNGGCKGGRPLDELGFDWSPGEGGRLLSSLHRSVSSQPSHLTSPYLKLSSRWTSHIFCLITPAFATGLPKLTTFNSDMLSLCQ